LRKGDRVYIHSLNQSGVVSSPPDAGGDVSVTAGIMKIKVKLEDLSRDTSEDTVTVNRRSVSHAVKAQKSASISPELDLRGMMVSEALEAADKYLDDAYLARLPSVRVVHGKGTGALRNAVHNHLKRIKYVKAFRLGEYGEGDAGVTVVTFKEN
jgi:DNA mismatch repair protein MutS2